MRVALHSDFDGHGYVPPPAAGWSSPPGRICPGADMSIWKRHLCSGFYLHRFQSISDGNTVAYSVRQYGASLIIYSTQYVTNLHTHYAS